MDGLRNVYSLLVECISPPSAAFSEKRIRDVVKYGDAISLLMPNHTVELGTRELTHYDERVADFSYSQFERCVAGKMSVRYAIFRGVGLFLALFGIIIALSVMPTVDPRWMLVVGIPLAGGLVNAVLTYVAPGKAI